MKLKKTHLVLFSIILSPFFSGCTASKILTENGVSKILTKNGCAFNTKNTDNEDTIIKWDGGCSNNYLSGEGTLKFYKEDGTYTGMYQGNMTNGMMNDTYGKLVPPNKYGDLAIYIGGYKNNQQHGYGEYWKPMGEYRGLLFKLKSNHGKIISKKYVGHTGRRANSSRTSGLNLSAGEAAAILAGAAALTMGYLSRGSSNSTSSTNEKDFEIKRKTKFYKKILTKGKYRKIYIRCTNGVSNYIEESYDYRNSGSSKHYFQANSGAVSFPKKFNTFEESAKELCTRHR